MGSSVYSTPVAANGRIYISTKDKLFAIEKKDSMTKTRCRLRQLRPGFSLDPSIRYVQL